MTDIEPPSDRLDAAPDHPVLLFDGVCNLCNGLVRFVVDRDPEGKFRFASLQSDVGAEFLDAAGLPTDEFDTFVLLDDDGVHLRSTAAIRVFRGLGLPYSLIYPLIVLPKPIRDAAYDVVASRRYAWFGRTEECRIPTPEERDRFLD